MIFIIEDEIHAEIQRGEYPSFSAALDELRRRSSLPWSESPNVAPCTSWKTCGRCYEIVEYDDSCEPWKLIRRTPVLEIDASNINWLFDNEDTKAEQRGCAKGLHALRHDPRQESMALAVESMERMEKVVAMVQEQLERIADQKVIERVSSLLVPPYTVQRGWDYGKPGEKLDCWMVLEHRESNTGIAYCSAGFGPRRPWGLLFLEGPHMGSGMDSAWFATLEDAFVESWASEESETKA